MGTISDKLTYLNETKSQLKDMINYGLPTDEQITSSTTFRNYVKSIFKAFIESLNDSSTLYSNLPKKSGTGANITLNDTANAPMRIELGASELTQAGTPTPSSPQDIHTISGSNKVVVCWKNLFNINGSRTGGEGYYTLSNDTIKITSATTSTFAYWNDKISVSTGTYTFMLNLINIEARPLIRFLDSSDNILSNLSISGWTWNSFYKGYWRDITTTGNNVFNISIPSTVSKVQIGFVPKTLNGEFNNIYFGIESTTYEPYTSQEADIDLGDIEYCKIGNYEDRIFKNVSGDVDYSSEREDGAWYIKKNIGKVVLDGSESGYEYFTSNENYHQINATLNISNMNVSDRSMFKCNYFDYYGNSTSAAKDRSGMTLYNTSLNFVFSIPNSLATSKTAWKEWLSTHNVKVCYPLATPTYTKITGTLATQLEYVYQMLKSYKGQTNISQVNDDLPFELNVSALEDLE